MSPPSRRPRSFTVAAVRKITRSDHITVAVAEVADVEAVATDETPPEDRRDGEAPKDPAER